MKGRFSRAVVVTIRLQSKCVLVHENRFLFSGLTAQHLHVAVWHKFRPTKLASTPSVPEYNNLRWDVTHSRTIYLDIGWVSSHLILLYSRTDGVVILCMYFESKKREKVRITPNYHSCPNYHPPSHKTEHSSPPTMQTFK